VLRDRLWACPEIIEGMRVIPLTSILSHTGRGYRSLKLSCNKPSGVLVVGDVESPLAHIHS